MENKVAVIAQSFCLPGSNTKNLWQNLLNKQDLITQVEPSRWDQESFLHPNKQHPGTSYTFAAGSIGDISLFDADFFNISPREATCIDPQQRLLLALAWETFENAGIAPSKIRGSDCGVFIGISSVDYASCLADDLAAMDSFTGTGSISSIAANRLSYFFDLQGPSMAIDTACSSALVAFHQACQSIKTGEISQALVGGINLHAHPFPFLSFSKATMLSKTGRCHVFDEAADGYVRSEGGGLFLLKNYNQAIADKDPIIAIVAGSAVNTDGHKSGLTIPSHKAQASLLRNVYKQAKIDSNEIDYIEAHGTGTPVGDPIETQAISRAIGKNRDKPLLIGSIKSNLGHLESASAVAGLAKAIECFKHRTLPATIGIKKLNPNIPFKDWNLKVVTETTALKKQGTLTIGVNSFGFGGVNAHVILQSPPSISVEENKSFQTEELPLILSAKTPEALDQAIDETIGFLSNNSKHSLYDIAHSSFFRRERHPHCALFFADSTESAIEKLKHFKDQENLDAQNVFTGSHLKNAKGLAFVYSGNGCQWVGMGKQLLEQSTVFKHTIAKIDKIFSQYASYSIEQTLNNIANINVYTKTEIAQPALFAVQVGITELLRSKGIIPTVVTGHSVGEVAAAWASGSLSLDDAVKVIYYRSYHQGKTQGQGQMTAISLDQNEFKDLISELKLNQLSLAGINSQHGITVSGSVEQLAQLEKELLVRNVFFKRLDLDYAFHSPAMDSIRSTLIDDIASLKTQKSTIPFYSTVTGDELISKDLDANYWWLNIREPVLFQHAINGIVDKGTNSFIEIGAHPVLSYYLKDILNHRNTDNIIIPSLKRNEDSLSQIMSCVAKTIMSGANIDEKHWFPITGNLVTLPNYPWQKQKFWHKFTSESYKLLNRTKVHPLLGVELAQHASTWENKLNTQSQAYLADHNVGGSIVFPGAAYAEMALAAAHQLNQDDFIEIEELEIKAPLILSESYSKVVRLSIDPRDLGFTINSRDHASSTTWVQQVVGRILGQATGNKLKISSPKIPTTKPDFSLASHSQLTIQTGLAYGPDFQIIKHGWSDKHSALGLFDIPDHISKTLGQYYLHPSVLDCTFQLVFQILKDDLKDHEGIAFVPIKMGRINFSTRSKIPCFAQATLKHRSPHSLNADFAIYDAESQVIAIISDVRFRAVKLHRPKTLSLSYLDYHLSATPLSLSTESIYSNSITSFYNALNKSHPLQDRYNQEVEPLLESLCLQFIVESLSTLSDVTGFLSQTLINELIENQPETSAFIHHIIAVAENNGRIEALENKGWQLIQDNETQEFSSNSIWNILIQDYPEYVYLIQLVGRLGLHLTDIIKGTYQAVALGVSTNSYAKIAHNIHQSSYQEYLTPAFISLTQAISDSFADNEERLNILEISSYKAEFATPLCSRLDMTQCSYTFLGLTDDAISSANNLHEHFPLIKVADLESIKEHSLANFAIINLDIINIQELQQLLATLPSLLMPGSKVFFIALQATGWIDTLLGTSQSWWVTQQDNNHVSPQLNSEGLINHLSSLGFTSPSSIKLNSQTSSGSYLIETGTSYQQSTLGTTNENWLILGSQNKTEVALANAISIQLNQHQQHVDLKSVVTESDIEVVLLLAKKKGINYQHIIHLCNIGASNAKAQTERCSLATKIIQACEATQSHATCWLLTKNVGSIIQTDQNKQVLHKGNTNIAHDAALWGFGRTLLNEATNYKIKLVDLCSNKLKSSVLSSLVSELLQGDDEQEVFISSTGKRYTPRLRMQNPPGSIEQINPHTTKQLSFDFPGQLRFLQWKNIPIKTPLADEIEVDVKATGLNFRDIMYTLGLLSDEAVENGFVGPSLGLEFAGIISKTGDDVTEFNVGDRVVGFAPSSFSNRIITKTTALTHIPGNIDFSAAATIPSTFFTVYYALHHQARLQPGETVLIHGAAGGVGIAAIQVARWLGAEIYATVGSEEKRDFLNLMGVKHIHNSRALDFAEEILAKTNNQGVDVILNSLAGEAINRNFQVLKPFGRFLELGKRDFYENTQIGLRPFRNNISYFGIDADQMMKERPDLTRQLFSDMMQLFHEGILHPLPYTSFDASQVVDAFRYMQQAKQIGKIVVGYNTPLNSKPALQIAEKQSLALDKDASYLVTGGFSGFGLRTAQWLVEKGAKHLILISRSGPFSDGAQDAIKHFKQQGINIYARACDVSDKKSLHLLLKQASASMPPLKGLIHSAAVIDDGLARNLDYEQIQRVLEPKILGGQYLHELTLDNKLDFFVLYSSVTTLFGNPGQSNYVAANLWLEALAAHRQQLGLPVTCVRWGAIEDVGYLARNSKIKDALKKRMGGSPLPSATALKELEQMIISNSNTIGVLEFEWNALKSFLPTAHSHKFQEIASHHLNDNDSSDNQSDIQQLIEELSAEELKTTFIGMLKKELSQILLIAEDKINPDTSMYDIGLDSLMGVELIVAIESRFEVQIPVMSLTDSPTLNKLTDHIITQLTSSETDASNTYNQIENLANRHTTETDKVSIGDLEKNIKSNTMHEKLIH